MTFVSVLSVLTIFLLFSLLLAAAEFLSRRWVLSSKAYLAASALLESVSRQRAAEEERVRKFSRKSGASAANARAQAEAALERLNRDDNVVASEQYVVGAGARATMISSAATAAAFFILPSLFPGPLLRLPFAPPPPFVWLTHRGLAGEDMTEAGAVLVLILSHFVARPLRAAAMGSPAAPAASFSTVWARVAERMKKA